jgi:hypothetical protein
MWSIFGYITSQNKSNVSALKKLIKDTFKEWLLHYEKRIALLKKERKCGIN